MDFDLVIRAHCRFSKPFPKKLGSSFMSGIISNWGTSILSSTKPEFSKKDFSEISGSIIISSVRGNIEKYSEVQTSEVYMPICMLRYDK